MNALNTGSYCDARQRLPTTLPVSLSTMIGERLEAMTPSAWRWQGRCVKLFDGTAKLMGWWVVASPNALHKTNR